MAKKESAEKAVRDIRRKTRRRFSAEEKIRIVIEGLRGEESIASLCRPRTRRPASSGTPPRPRSPTAIQGMKALDPRTTPAAIGR